MRVLVTGATGFIGSHVVAALLAAGHEPVPCARDKLFGKRRLPGLDWLKVDFNTETSIADWLPRVRGVDAVVNCAGILQGSIHQSMDKVHRAGPIALFAACARAGVRRVVQVSAIGADPDGATAFSRSKAKADAFIAGLDLDWIVLRPSLVYGAGSYGGTSLLRGLAALLFGTGLGTAYFLWRANRSRDVAAIARTARHVVTADWLFVAGPGVVQLATGIALVEVAGYGWDEGWLLAAIALFLLAFACWLPVVGLQMRMRGLAETARSSGAPLPESYARLARAWFALGWPAFFAMLGLFVLMVFRPTLS